MKKLLLTLFVLLFSLQSFGQNGALYGIWYLINYEIDGEYIQVSDVSPHISPYMIIGGDTDFSGDAACNDYSGTFGYDGVNDLLIVESFDSTLNVCEYQAHNEFELDYFNFLAIGTTFFYGIIHGTDGLYYLELTIAPGLALHFRNYPLLSVEDRLEEIFIIHPNPVSDILYFSSEGISIENLSVYAISGQQMMSQSGNTNSIDVSALSEGIYFLEIRSENRRQILKFIKE